MDLELLPADENGTFCVVDDVITDTSQEGSSELAHSSSSGYNHVGFFFFCYGDDCLPCFSFFGHEFRRFLNWNQRYSASLVDISTTHDLQCTFSFWWAEVRVGVGIWGKQTCDKACNILLRSFYSKIVKLFIKTHCDFNYSLIM